MSHSLIILENTISQTVLVVLYPPGVTAAVVTDVQPRGPAPDIDKQLVEAHALIEETLVNDVEETDGVGQSVTVDVHGGATCVPVVLTLPEIVLEPLREIGTP
jgi:hypothetical protein